MAYDYDAPRHESMTLASVNQYAEPKQKRQANPQARSLKILLPRQGHPKKRPRHKHILLVSIYTLINQEESYPHQDIAIVIWPDDADKVSSVLNYGGKELCIKGEITTYKDTPQISLKNPSQIVN